MFVVLQMHSQFMWYVNFSRAWKVLEIEIHLQLKAYFNKYGIFGSLKSESEKFVLLENVCYLLMMFQVKKEYIFVFINIIGSNHFYSFA